MMAQCVVDHYLPNNLPFRKLHSLTVLLRNSPQGVTICYPVFKTVCVLLWIRTPQSRNPLRHSIARFKGYYFVITER